MNSWELGQELDVKRALFKKKWDGYSTKDMPNGAKVKDVPGKDIEGLRKLMDEINQLAEKHEVALEVEQKAEAMGTPVNRLMVAGGEQGVCDSLFATGQWQDRVSGKFGEVELADQALRLLDVKATMTTGAGFAPQSIRDGFVVPAISRPPQVMDFLRIEATDQNAVKFMKQSARMNAADAKAEAAAFGEATIAYSEATTPIRKVGVFLPVSEEQLEDEPGVKAIIENDLKLMVRQKLDEQITVGDGTGQNLTGLLEAPSILGQARGTDSEFDAIMKAMTKVRTAGRAKPNLVVLHSENYQRLALTKTTDGQYIFGSPSGEPLQRIWGVQIATSEALPAGTGLVMDTDYARIKLRRDLGIAASDSHGSNFTAGVLAIRAHVRAGLQILRDQAICSVTGLQS